VPDRADDNEPQRTSVLSRAEGPRAEVLDDAAPAAVGTAAVARPRARERRDLPVRVVSPEVRLGHRVAEIWRFRQLLLAMINKEFKVKYRNSVLGFAWSMLNPAATIAIFYFVFQIVLGSGIPDFAIFLMSGMVVYNLFQYAAGNATPTVINNSQLVKKVAFPREILALASVGTAMVFFVFQAIVLVAFLAVFRYSPDYAYLPDLIPALVALILFVSALAIFLAAVNVYMRDIQHLMEIVVGTAWFWATPIVYSFATIQTRLSHYGLAWVPLLNPLTDIVLVFQRALYHQSGVLPVGVDQWWYLWHLGAVIGASIVLFVVAMVIFARLESNFAEEL
jgi:ABC-2 type transport system permease protein